MSHDVDELRRTHPAPAAITLSPEHRARLAGRVDRAIARRDARTRVAIGIAAPATVLACATAVAAMAVLALTGGAPVTPDPERPVLASAPATRVLERAADSALSAAVPTVREDQFVYTRSATITNEGRFGSGVTLGPVHEREIWLARTPGRSAGGTTSSTSSARTGRSSPVGRRSRGRRDRRTPGLTPCPPTPTSSSTPSPLRPRRSTVRPATRRCST